MSEFWIGNVYLLLAILFTSASHVTLKALLNETGPVNSNWSSVQALLAHGGTVQLPIALAMLVAGFVLWMMSLSRLDISYAYPVASSSVVVVTLFGMLFLGESVTFRAWCGVILILVGTVLLAPTR